MRVLITGGSRGLGRALLQHYISHEAEVVTVSRQLIQEKGVTSYQVDLSQPDQWLKFFSSLDKAKAFDVCIHNLAVNFACPFVEMNEQQINQTFDLNTAFPLSLTQHLLKYSLLKKSSSLVFVNSLGHYTTYPGSSVYVASKSALHSMARSLRFVNKDIHILEVFPGPMDTDMAKDNSPLDSNSNRISPDLVAKKIARAVDKKKNRLIPSFSMKIVYYLAKVCPVFIERIVLKSIYHPMQKNKII